MRKNKLKSMAAALLAASMGLTLAACGGGSAAPATASESEANVQSDVSGQGDTKIVNIGVTSDFASVNPLLMDGTEIMKYATGLEFLPMVELNADLSFEPMLASSITTEDNLHFLVTIDEAATWSDGVPVTADDMVFSVLKYASPTIGNTSLLLYAFEGIGDEGWTEEGAAEISGVTKVGDKQVEFTTKYPMALTTFENTYGRYLLTLPEHVLGEMSDEELRITDWFNHPTVVNGPYIIEEALNGSHIAYTANTDYWRGTPNIEKLNILCVQPATLLSGLTSGEIDFVQPSMGSILQEDYEAVEALENVTAVYSKPVTHQGLFINTERITDVRIRQALLYGIDRDSLVNNFYNGNAEVVDGFVSSASPFYSEDLVPVAYDMAYAASLVQEAVEDGAWDADQVLSFYVNSGDSTFVNAAAYIAQQLGDIGLQTEITTLDLSSLMAAANEGDCDFMAVQYTFSPVDPYPDASWLLSDAGWTNYISEDVSAALSATQTTSDIAAITENYKVVDSMMQEEVPMISLCVLKALGACSDRLVNAQPDIFGSFNHVEQWDIAQ